MPAAVRTPADARRRGGGRWRGRSRRSRGRADEPGAAGRCRRRRCAPMQPGFDDGGNPAAPAAAVRDRGTAARRGRARRRARASFRHACRRRSGGRTGVSMGRAKARPPRHRDDHDDDEAERPCGSSVAARTAGQTDVRDRDQRRGRAQHERRPPIASSGDPTNPGASPALRVSPPAADGAGDAARTAAVGPNELGKRRRGR